MKHFLVSLGLFLLGISQQEILMRVKELRRVIDIEENRRLSEEVSQNLSGDTLIQVLARRHLEFWITLIPRR